jgi:hypothetical protein
MFPAEGTSPAVGKEMISGGDSATCCLLASSWWKFHVLCNSQWHSSEWCVYVLHASSTQFNTKQMDNTSALCLVEAIRCVQSFTFLGCCLSSVLCPTGHKTPATEHSQLLLSMDHYACVVVKKNIPKSPSVGMKWASDSSTDVVESQVLPGDSMYLLGFKRQYGSWCLLVPSTGSCFTTSNLVATLLLHVLVVSGIYIA